MTWEQYVALLKTLGVTVPVDLTDPRLDEAKLAETREAVKTAYTEARTGGKDLATLRQLGDAVKAVQNEITVRVETAKLDADIKAVGQPEDEDEGEGEGEGEGDDAEGKSGEDVDLEPDRKLLVADGVGDGTETDTKTSKELAAAATAALASASGGQSEGDRDGSTAGDGVRAPMVAALSAGDVQYGQEVDSAKIGRLAADAVAALRAGQSGLREGQPGNVVRLASVLAYADRPGHDEDQVLSMENGPAKNTAILRKLLAAHTAAVKNGDPGAKTAATFCAPYDVIREIPDSTSTATPLRESLAFAPFSHGGFTFNAGVQFADVAGAVDIWTVSDQDSVSANNDATWKPVYEIVCPTPTTLVAADWITAGVTWKVGMDINNPENVADVFKKVEGQRARRGEQWILSMLDPLLTNYHYTSTLGSADEASIPHLVSALVASFSHAGYDHRLRDDISYTMYFDTGMLGNLVVDRVRTAFGVGREQEGVLGYLRSVISEAGLPIDRFVQLMERQPTGTNTNQGEAYGALKANGNPYSPATYPPAAGAAAIDGPDILTRFRVRLVPTSEVFIFGTGEIRTGVRQDFAMARQNKLGWFVEEAIKLGKFGVSPWFALNIDLCPNGARTGWIDPADIDCASAIGS